MLLSWSCICAASKLLEFGSQLFVLSFVQQNGFTSELKIILLTKSHTTNSFNPWMSTSGNKCLLVTMGVGRKGIRNIKTVYLLSFSEAKKVLGLGGNRDWKCVRSSFNVGDS